VGLIRGDGTMMATRSQRQRTGKPIYPTALSQVKSDLRALRSCPDG
jgi:hypothetical protein